MPTPSDRAASTELTRRVSPSNRMLPESGCVRPATHRIKVVLPAPFSPTTAWTVPASTAIEIELQAVTAPNVLVSPTTSMRGGRAG